MSKPMCIFLMESSLSPCTSGDDATFPQTQVAAGPASEWGVSHVWQGQETQSQQSL